MVEITNHARERMRKYSVAEDIVLEALKNPDTVIDSHTGRKIHQKKLMDMF